MLANALKLEKQKQLCEKKVKRSKNETKQYLFERN